MIDMGSSRCTVNEVGEVRSGCMDVQWDGC